MPLPATAATKEVSKHGWLTSTLETIRLIGDGGYGGERVNMVLNVHINHKAY